MSKIGAFHFFTVVLPALVFILVFVFLLEIDIPLDLTEETLLVLVILLPLSLLIGAILTRMGYWMEGFIDKKLKLKHPVVEIFASYPEVLEKMKKLFPDIVVDSGDEISSEKMDALFEKARVLMYQKQFSTRAKNMAMLATFYRNLVPISLLIIVLMLFSLTPIGILYGKHFLDIGLLILLTFLLGLSGRWLSQSEYKAWFHEVLKNLDVYFKENCKE